MAYLPSAGHRQAKERPKTENELPNKVQFKPNPFFSAVDGGVQELAKMPEKIQARLTKNLQDLSDVFTHLLNEHKKPEHTATIKTKSRIS